jgi:BMFP domain-containing protein YqiC
MMRGSPEIIGLRPCGLGEPVLLQGKEQPAQRPADQGDSDMSSGTTRILDDLAKLMTDAAGSVQSAGKDLETGVKAQVERWLNSMDIVKREEFDAVRDMAIKARDENDALRARIDALEAKLKAKAGE